jgi:imidazolonepropionase
LLDIVHGFNGNPIAVIPTFLGVPPLCVSGERNAGKYLDRICSETLPQIASRKIAQFAEIICGDTFGEKGFDPEHCRIFLNAARQLGIGVKIHAGHSSGAGAVQLAIEVNAASIDGLNATREQDADALAAAPTVATLLPADFIDGTTSQAPNARLLIDRGAAVALATGLHHSRRTTYNMQSVIGMACTQMDMTVAEAIVACTINAACAIHRADRVGSLQKGKEADVIMLNVSDYREIPLYYGGNQVAMTIKRGEIFYHQPGLSIEENC